MRFYAFARALVYGICKVLFRVQISGKEHVPTTGAFIVAPSHRSYFDTPFVSFITRRRIRFMAKEELFEHPLGNKLFTALGAIPVTRGSIRRGRAGTAPTSPSCSTAPPTWR